MKQGDCLPRGREHKAAAPETPSPKTGLTLSRYLKLQDVGNVHNINLITPEQ